MALTAPPQNTTRLEQGEVCRISWPLEPSWAAEALNKVESLFSLPRGWDGRSAPRISPSHAVVTFKILAQCVEPKTPCPSFVPTLWGGIQVEWHLCGIDLELTVDSRGCSLFAEDSKHALLDVDEEGEVDLQTFKKWIQVLSRRASQSQDLLWRIHQPSGSFALFG
jgi:hypothetical protein